jgi:hypothetical protein
MHTILKFPVDDILIDSKIYIFNQVKYMKTIMLIIEPHYGHVLLRKKYIKLLVVKTSRARASRHRHDLNLNSKHVECLY